MHRGNSSSKQGLGNEIIQIDANNDNSKCTGDSVSSWVSLLVKYCAKYIHAYFQFINLFCTFFDRPLIWHWGISTVFTVEFSTAQYGEYHSTYMRLCAYGNSVYVCMHVCAAHGCGKRIERIRISFMNAVLGHHKYEKENVCVCVQWAINVTRS